MDNDMWTAFNIAGFFFLFVFIAARIRAGIRSGPGALIGLQKVEVKSFENVLVYRVGTFQRVLHPGSYWISPKLVQLIRVDMRPSVFRINQACLTIDNMPANIDYLVRIKVTDPRKAIESCQNFQHEATASMQSIVKVLSSQRSQQGVLYGQEEFGRAIREATINEFTKIGIECVGLEILKSGLSQPDKETEIHHPPLGRH
jgi:regulator of protease activity HflC (stomatin/prohibitin superfamily)